MTHFNPDEIRIGDELTVRGTVILTHLASEPRYAVVEFSNGETQDVPIGDFVSHTPAPPPPLKVGERVCWNSSPGVIRTSRLIAIDGDEAWVHVGANGHRGTLPLASLRRI